MLKPRKYQGRGIFLLPNLFTTGALFAAFYAIIAAMQSQFDIAAIAIFVAMLADAIDGRVARLTNTTSSFGAQYDSLSDMVSFGVAPAIVIYSWALSDIGRFGWLAAFIYTAAVAMRLARFNVQTATVDKRYFHGLASPAAAAVIASFVWLCDNLDIAGQQVVYIVACIAILLAGLMVSNIRYYSFKDIDFKQRVPFVMGLLIVLGFVAISFDPPLILLMIFSAYALSGVVYTLYILRKIRQSSRGK